jgi:catechol 2,3-dioxygenase-like lactoylglutathione lyase family enzyme
VNRPIDHLVVCVRDLERASAFYERLGFTLTPRAQHPFGTANRLAQFGGNFLEILAVADAARIPPARGGHFSFGAFNADYLKGFEGMSMLVFASSDARRDHAEFASRGLDTYEPFDFSRAARLPDGREVTVAFSIAFVTHAEMPNAAFFVCQQHSPQHFWKPEYQSHANGARAIREVVMVADRPKHLADFFARLAEPSSVTLAGDELRVGVPDGRIRVVTPARFLADHPASGSVEVPEGPRFATYSVGVEDLAAVEALLRQREIPYRRNEGRLQISAENSFGVVVEFEADPK